MKPNKKDMKVGKELGGRWAWLGVGKYNIEEDDKNEQNLFYTHMDISKNTLFLRKIQLWR